MVSGQVREDDAAGVTRAKRGLERLPVLGRKRRRDNLAVQRGVEDGVEDREPRAVGREPLVELICEERACAYNQATGQVSL